MDVFKHVRAWVLGDPLIVAQVGTRVYPVKLPQTVTYPAITIQQISGVRHTPLKGRASLARPRFQFDVWTREGAASAFESSRSIGQLLLDRLEGRNINVLDDEVSPAEYRRLSFEFDNDQDLFEPGVNGGYYRYSADYFVMYQTGHGPVT